MQAQKKVKFSNDSKNHDGSSYITEECYKIVSAFFNKSTIYHKKIGKTQEEIDDVLRNNVTFSPYCVKQFVKAKKTGKCDILLPIQSADDCVNAVGGDISVIYECIGHLNRSLENIKEKRIEKFRRAMEEPIRRKLEEVDGEWDKTCTADVCYNRNCCYDKKMKMKLKDNVSIIRSGGRDCNCVAPLEYGVWIEKLLGILKAAVEKDDSSEDDDNLYEDKIMV